MDILEFTIEEAINYSKMNKLDFWLQSFLRNDKGENANLNIALADGLLIEERFYLGPTLIDLDKLTPVRIENDIEDQNDLKFYNECVSSICNYYKDYNLPPLIVEYKNSKLYLTDGNHRYSALKKLNVKDYYVIVWGNKNLEEEAKHLL